MEGWSTDSAAPADESAFAAFAAEMLRLIVRVDSSDPSSCATVPSSKAGSSFTAVTDTATCASAETPESSETL